MESSLLLEQFLRAETFSSIQQSFLQLQTSVATVTHRGNIYERFAEYPWRKPSNYPHLRNLYRLHLVDKERPTSKASKLWALIDKKRSLPVYCSQKACANLRILVVGAGESFYLILITL